MKLSFSGIAWDTSEDTEMAALFSSQGLDAIDVAPGKYFPDIKAATTSEVLAVREHWSNLGFSVVGMQSLLFGTTGLNLFGELEVQDKMLDHLTAVCRVGAILGATRLVFGSPKNRDRTGVADEAVLSRSVDFFRRVGQRASDFGVMICLEPNPPLYGSNFMTTTFEAAEVVRAVEHPSIRLQFDTGALLVNGEDPWDTVRKYRDMIGHIHLSEPGLVPLGDSGRDHSAISEALEAMLPDHTATIEMVATSAEPHLDSNRRALNFVKNLYGAGNKT